MYTLSNTNIKSTLLTLLRTTCHFSLAVSVFIFISCDGDTDDHRPVEAYSPRLKNIKTFDRGYILLNKGNSIKPDFSAIPIRYKVIDNLALFQGDIILGPSDKFADQSNHFQKGISIESLATEITTLLWPDQKVHFVIDQNAERYRRTIEEAIKEWQSLTGFEFHETKEKKGNYIKFIRKEGYASFIGMQGGEQILTIPAHPEKGNIMHEIGHALGLWHEHSRKDRDNYIQVNYQNIEEGYNADFDKICCDVATYDTKYDFGSLMHYPPNAFSKEGNTIQPLTNDQIGQRERISEVDKEGINKLYKIKQPQ